MKKQTEEQAIEQAVKKCSYKSICKETNIKEFLNEIERVWDISYDNGTTFFTKKDKSFRCNNWEGFKGKLLNDVLSQSNETEVNKE